MATDLALQVGKDERPVLAVWKEWLTWKNYPNNWGLGIIDIPEA